MLISVIIPIYNEEKQLPQTFDAVIKVLEKIGYDFELIFIDDGSKDNSWEILESFSSYKCLHTQTGNVRSAGFSRNFGKEAAISAGLNLAKGDAAIIMDGDLQHPPEYIPEMLRLWNKGETDIVEGVKAGRKGENVFSRINAFIFYKFFAKATGYDLNNASDFKLLDRKVLDTWKDFGEHDTFFRGLSAWVGFSRKSFNFTVSPRAKGKSRWSFINLIRLSINAVTSFSTLPLHLITIIGVFFLLFSFGLSIQTLVNWFRGTAETGFTTVILLILFTGGAIMLSLGLIGIYIGRIFTEVKSRPRYIISKTADSSKSTNPTKPEN